jgi:hypothetical protein
MLKYVTIGYLYVDDFPKNNVCRGHNFHQTRTNTHNMSLDENTDVFESTLPVEGFNTKQHKRR